MGKKHGKKIPNNKEKNFNFNFVVDTRARYRDIKVDCESYYI